jgi:hypothetical protein
LYTWVFQVVFFPEDSPPKPFMQITLSVDTTFPTHLILLDLIT